MRFETPDSFSQFALLDSGLGFRLERWNNATLVRPDPQAIWQRQLPEQTWNTADATFDREWHVQHADVFRDWCIRWREVSFKLRLTPFKHVGLFAEQASHWEWLQERLQKSGRKLKLLNLFAYTGGATMVMAKQGHFVTHVDASKPAITWAKDNQRLNMLASDSIRWILDDAVSFVQRELRRGAIYDGIILDPPAFGHGPSGKIWRFSHDFPALLKACASLLAPRDSFLILNSYATNMSALGLYNLALDTLSAQPGTIEWGELCLKQTTPPRTLSTGCFVRYSA